MKQFAVCAVVLAGTLVFSSSAAHATPPHYRIIDLGVLGGSDSASQGIGVSPHHLTAVGRDLTDFAASRWYASRWYASRWYASRWYASRWYGQVDASRWYGNEWYGSAWYGAWE